MWGGLLAARVIDEAAHERGLRLSNVMRIQNILKSSMKPRMNAD